MSFSDVFFCPFKLQIPIRHVWTTLDASSYVTENCVDNKNWYMPHVMLSHSYVPQGWISWKRVLAWAHCFQRVLNDSVEPGAQKKKPFTPRPAILKQSCVKGKLFGLTTKGKRGKENTLWAACGKQCQAVKWKKKGQRWSWAFFFDCDVDYMSNISRSICLAITTLYVSGLLASTTGIINSIFQPDAQTCHYSLYLPVCVCVCSLEREMERHCER